ncbi:MAG: multicopper oxidase family protein [Pseudomonadota bacterium]
MSKHVPARLVTRRRLLKAAGAGALAAGLPLSQGLLAAESRTDLTIQPASFPVTGPVTRGMVSTSPDAPPPVIRMAQHQAFRSRVNNTLADHTAMHWHGIRVPNAMDGVPYLTQIPIGPGESYDYAFTPQDAGTFWYHPHCMTMDQMALGFTGVLVVEEAEDPGFDTDIALNLRDFRLNGEGQFIDLWTARGAARGGTFGTVMTANWQTAPGYEAPSGGLLRLRLTATDTTRVYQIFVPGAEGQVIALDGHPLETPFAIPQTEEDGVVLSPGQRADLAIRMPASEGQSLTVMTAAPGPARQLATLTATGPDTGRDLRELRPLPPNPVAIPDLANARREEFVFGWSPIGDLPDNGLCGTLGYTFWSINRQAWPGDAVAGTGPLATFRLGESAVLRLRNESPNRHPIHLHGLTFRVIASNQREIRSHWTDTALLLPEESLDIALVMDNPGDWAFHCHIIEHQKTGLAGFIRVLDA